MDFDPDDFIDKTVQFDKPVSMLIAQAEKDPSMMSRLWSAQQLGTGSLENRDARVEALAHLLGNDGFYGVRAVAATALGRIGGEKAKAALVSGLRQPDSRVREAVVGSLGNFAKDQAIYSVLVNALHEDSSYAVQAAAAKALGKSGVAQAFDILRAQAMTNPELHVMRATLAGLAETKDARAAEILLAQAQPGAPEAVRLSALGGLENLKETVAQNHLTELVEVVRAALHDPFYFTREAAEELVGVFDLVQFESDIQAEAQGAPLAMQRRPAQQVLEQLHHKQ